MNDFLRVSYGNNGAEILVDGTTAGLLELASACLTAVNGFPKELTGLSMNPAYGYSNVVNRLQIVPDVGRLQTDFVDGLLQLKGGPRILALLAEEVTEIGELEPGPTTQWFYYPGNVHLEHDGVQFCMRRTSHVDSIPPKM